VRWVVAQPGPDFSVHDTYVGWVEALRAAGQHVVEFNLSERLTVYGAALKQVGAEVFQKMFTAEQAYALAADGLNSMLYKAWPDILFVVSGFFIPTEILDKARRTRTRVVVLHTESPYEDERALTLAPYADLMLVDDPTNVDRFAQVTKALYMPKAYRPSVHHPGPAVPGLECDLAFVGTAFESRIDFFERMDLDGLDVLLAGNWTQLAADSKLRPFLAHGEGECLDNEKAADVYRSARVGLNLYRREAQSPELAAGWAMGPRELEMAACGLFFLRDPRGEGDQVLDMLPTFGSPGEASELLRYWLARPDERRQLADKAREAVADRSFDRNAAALLRLLN
jgi:spore maturation protein CgeB